MHRLTNIFYIIALIVSCKNSTEIVNGKSDLDTYYIELCDTNYFDCNTSLYGKLKDTLPNGICLVYDYNRETDKKTLCLQSKYYNNVRNGIEIEYYHENGSILQKTFYKNGLIDGNSILISPLGDTSHNYNFKKGLRHGICSYWEEGNFYTGLYENDNREGEWKVYNVDKKLFELRNFKKDSLIKVIKIVE